MTSYPLRLLIGPDFLPEIRQEFLDRSINCHTLCTPHDGHDWQPLLRAELRALGLCSTDVVIALPNWVEVALDELGIAVPTPPDYPQCTVIVFEQNLALEAGGGFFSSRYNVYSDRF